MRRIFITLLTLLAANGLQADDENKKTSSLEDTNDLFSIPVVVEKHNNILNIASSELIRSVSIEGRNRPIEESMFVALDITGETGTIEVSVETTSGIYESEIDTAE
jgi:hypothetical protein